MPYTKAGPFVDGGAPYLNAAFFNGIESALSATEGAANTVNPVTGWFHVDQYGAVGDGTTVDRAAIQAAINAANAAYLSTGAMQRVYFPARTFIVDGTNYYKDDGTLYGITSLLLLDGVDLAGPGTLKVKAGAYGTNALYAIVRAKSGGLSNSAITGLTFDGNTANVAASQQCSNIDMYVKANVTVAGTLHITANGNAMILHGPTGSPATNIEMRDNTILAASMIGIQASHFNGLTIRGNYVAGCTNNGIDIYGENNGSTTVDGTNFTITGNTVTGCMTGIFPETVAQGVISGNVISGCTESGVHINRINGQPHDILIDGNTITGTPNGVWVTGDTGGIVVRGNTIAGFTTAGVHLGAGSGNCSYILIDGNTLNPSGTTTPLVLLDGNQITQIRVRGTATNAANRAYDQVSQATTVVSVTYEPTFLPETMVNRIVAASAGTFTIGSVPTTSGGTLTIHGTMGGGWHSIWHGVWVSDGAGKVTVAALGSAFTATGQAVSSVTGSATGSTITVTAAASGSSGTFDYTLRRTTA